MPVASPEFGKCHQPVENRKDVLSEIFSFMLRFKYRQVADFFVQSTAFIGQECFRCFALLLDVATDFFLRMHERAFLAVRQYEPDFFEIKDADFKMSPFLTSLGVLREHMPAFLFCWSQRGGSNP